MHLALASLDDPAFAPEPATADDLGSLLTEFHGNAVRAFEALKTNVSRLPDDLIEAAGRVLARRRRVFDFFKQLDTRRMRALRTRIHGNYHLGTVLRAKTDYLIIGFEADLSLPLTQRSAKQLPLKDVASMLRSLSYAPYATLINYAARRPVDLASLIPWARLCERSAAAAFLHAYRETAANAEFLPADSEDFRLLLQAYVMDKALEELLYELDNRPAWVRIPLEGILSLSFIDE
jgi:maltose alpha-D-glucosyltransferase/alpha-amylase